MDKLSTKLDKACIPSPHFSKIAEVFSSSQIDEQEAFSPLLTPRKKTTHGGFFASLLFLLLIGTAAGSGWYFGKQGSWSRQPQAPLLSTTLNLDKSTARGREVKFTSSTIPMVNLCLGMFRERFS